ncbi:MAG: hypothetical protein AAGH60_13660 [Pseudomonadota bacterium]
MSILASPSTLDKVTDFEEGQFDQVIDLFRGSVPATIIDLPHAWTGWVRRTLVDADDVAITATPDLASLRNAKNLIDTLKQARPNDTPPKLVLNMASMPKRPEIEAKDFADALSMEPAVIVPFDAEVFGNAANSGHMIAEVSARHDAVASFDHLAHRLSGRKTDSAKKKGGLTPIVKKLLQGRKAS